MEAIYYTEALLFLPQGLRTLYKGFIKEPQSVLTVNHLFYNFLFGNRSKNVFIIILRLAQNNTMRQLKTKKEKYLLCTVFQISDFIFSLVVIKTDTCVANFCEWNTATHTRYTVYSTFYD